MHTFKDRYADADIAHTTSIGQIKHSINIETFLTLCDILKKKQFLFRKGSSNFLAYITLAK